MSTTAPAKTRAGGACRGYYDPATAQFTTGDPLYALSGSRYGYAGKDPINDMDGESQRSVDGPGMIAGAVTAHRPLELPGCQVHRCRRVNETTLQSC
jgi:hypothetical protein